FHTKFGIGTGLLFIILNIYFFFTRYQDSKRPNKNIELGFLGSVAAAIFAFLFAFRDNGLVQIIDFLTAVFSSFVAIYFYKFSGHFSFRIPNFISVPLIVIDNFVKSFINLFRHNTWSSQSLENDKTSSLIKGLVIAVPIVASLLFLLVRADPIFGKLTQDIMKNVGERTIVSLVIFIVMFTFGIIKILEKVTEEKVSEIAKGKSHELIVITGSVLFLFAVFISVQFRYLFLGVEERELSQLGITSLTYSEYVRRGFFELLIASTISSGVIVYALKYLHFLTDRQKPLVQIFTAVCTVETGLILLSAVKRVALYADAHGLTRARVFGFVFLIWLAVLLTIFLIRVFKQWRKEKFFTSVLISTFLILLSVNLINIDGLIATKYRPTVNEEIDYYYLTNLSTDAVESWIPAILDSERIISQLEKNAVITPEDNRKLYWAKRPVGKIKERVDYLNKKYEVINQWQSFNLAEYHSFKAIKENKDIFSKIAPLLDKANQLQARVSNSVIQDTQLDRSLQPPLLY
ncbi:DUF4173 domain-containing protein, partial [Candidatus Daviesbacteria bacterium]|nr:DUF4173 domain-containing protein [Candidatus Daviesbacteria bacterium]